MPRKSPPGYARARESGVDGREELLLALHGSVSVRPAWEPFLERCRLLLDLSYASLIFRRGPGKSVDAEFSAGEAVPEDRKRLYRQQFGAIDPVLYFAMEPGRSYRLPELLRTGSTAEHPYYRDFLEPSRLSRMMSARIVETGGEVAWLSFCRGSDQPDFSAEEQALFDSLLPHMAIALHGFLLIERHRVRAAIGRHVSMRFDMAAITLTAAGKVLGMGAVARTLVEHSPLLSITPDNHLQVNDSIWRKQFSEAIATVLSTRHSKALLLTTEEGRLELLLTPFDRQAGHGVVHPDLVLYMRQEGAHGSSDDLRPHLIDMFGLTETETSIALGLAAGRSMAELAGDLGFTENTIRSYSRSIYAKLGVRRQVDLVRLILISVAQLG